MLRQIPFPASNKRVLQFWNQYFLRPIAFTILCTLISSCSTNSPAPITDRSSNTRSIKEPAIANNTSSSTTTVNPIPAPKPIVQKKTSKEVPKSDIKNDTVASSTTSGVENAFKLAKPSSAPVINSFNEVSNKGVDFGGKLGDPVLAAADGKVIYAGSNLRTYGNLVIVNHNNGFVTVYANNKSLLVKEGETVKRGQKIAEMGNSESDKVKLHFELRKNSKPVDPMVYFAEN